MKFLRISSNLMFSCFIRLLSRHFSLFPITYWLLVSEAFSPNPAFAYSNQGQLPAISSARASQGPNTNIKSVVYRNWMTASQDQAKRPPMSRFDLRGQTFVRSRPALDQSILSKSQAPNDGLPPERFNGPSPAPRKGAGLPRSDRGSPKSSGGQELLSVGQSSLKAAFGNMDRFLESTENVSTIRLPAAFRAVSDCPSSGTTLTKLSAVFSAGSTGSRSSSTCAWTLAPPNATALKLSFSSFNLQRCCDILEIFQCIDQYCEEKTKIAAPVAGNNIPASIISVTGAMQVVFTSSFGPESEFRGFEASYTALCPLNSYGEIVTGFQDCIPCRTSCMQGKQLAAACALGSSSDTTQCSCPVGFYSDNSTSPCQICTISCLQGRHSAHVLK